MIPSPRATLALTLSRLSGVGRRTAALALERFPSEDALLGASEDELVDRLGRRAATAIVDGRPRWHLAAEWAERTIDAHVEAGMGIVALGDEDYSPLLAASPDPPVALYVRGSVGALAAVTPVAIVGTREATPNGLELGRRIARHFASAGAVIVSGLAAGIDTAAHEGALEAGATIAVLGTPVDKVYPAANKRLASMIETSGALVSEYPIGSATNGNSFVERDRIQAGLSLAVIAVQTGLVGGTMHTVRFAEEAGRRLLSPRPAPSETGLPQWAGIASLLDGKRSEPFEADDVPRIMGELSELRTSLLRRETAPTRARGPARKRRGEAPAGQESWLLPEEPATTIPTDLLPEVHTMGEVVTALDATLDRLGPRYDESAFDEVVRQWRRRRYPEL